MTHTTVHIDTGQFHDFTYRTNTERGRAAGYVNDQITIWFAADTPEHLIRLGKALIVEGHNWNDELLAADGNKNTDL
jgi:hypothetical protein